VGFIHAYEVRPRLDKRGVDLISDVLPFGRLWYDGPNAIQNAIGYAKFYSRSHDAVIRVYDAAGKRDRNTRARGRVQRVVSFYSHHAALIAKLNLMDTSVKALQEAVVIRRRIDTLEKRLSSILRGSLPAAVAHRGGPHRVSAATRAKLASAARARWARINAGKERNPFKKKGGLTPAGRKRLSQLMKARWAARRRGSARTRSR
jgi:hypothetical protein